MTDAISRSAAIADLKEWLYRKPRDEFEEGFNNALSGAIERIGNSNVNPALDVEPVVHAKWIEDGYYGIPCVCSHCGTEAHYTSTFVEKFDYDWEENLVPCGYEEIREYIRSNRCPECGAIMDGEADA